MLRALAWKEWREQRPVLGAALGLALLLPLFLLINAWIRSDGTLDLSAVAMNTSVVYVALIWPLTALLAGASALAETRASTLPFLFTRPVMRTTVWCVKTAVGAACVVAVAAVTGLAGRLLVSMTGGGAVSLLRFPALDDVLAGANGMLAGRRDALIFVCTLLLLYTTAVFFSTLISHTLLAAATAFALSAGVLSLAIAVRIRMSLILDVGWTWILAEIALLSALLLLASLFVFARGELRAGPGRWTSRGILGVATVIAAACLVTPILFAVPHLSVHDARVVGMVFTPTSPSMALNVTTASNRGSWIWALDPTAKTRPGSPVRLTGVGAGAPSFTPDGEWVVYLASDWVTMTVGIRAVRPDGTDDRIIVKNLPGSGWFVAEDLRVSPDGSRVALTRGWHLAVADLHDGGLAVSLDLGGMPAERATLLGWTADSQSIVLLINPIGSNEDELAKSASRLETLDVKSGQRRVIRELGAFAYAPGARSPAGGIRTIPILETDRRTWRGGGGMPRFSLSLTDVASGAIERVSETSCGWFTVSLTDDARWLAWTDCGPDGHTGRVVRVRDLSNGSEHEVFRLDRGNIFGVEISPAGDRLLFQTCAGGVGSCSVTIVDVGGRLWDVEGNWQSAHWLADGGVLLAGPAHPAERLALVDRPGDSPRTIFP